MSRLSTLLLVALTPALLGQLGRSLTARPLLLAAAAGVAAGAAVVVNYSSSKSGADKVVAEIPGFKTFQGTDYFDNVGYGESVYAPINTQLLNPKANTRPEDFAQWGRIASALAQQGIYVNSHVEMEPAIDSFLTLYEGINREKPIKGLRWALSHIDQVTPAQIERMKRLGMSAQIHTRPLIQGVLMHRVHGDRAWDMPPFRLIQDSGIPWGLGSDATAVTTSAYPVMITTWAFGWSSLTWRSTWMPSTSGRVKPVRTTSGRQCLKSSSPDWPLNAARTS